LTDLYLFYIFHLGWRYNLEMFFKKLTQLSSMNEGIAVVMVNHAVKKNYFSSAEDGTAFKPAMGMYWQHKPDFRIQLYTTNTMSSLRRAVLEKSSRTQSMKGFDFSMSNGVIV
jgi:aspartyl-tRNA synthetase